MPWSNQSGGGGGGNQGGGPWGGGGGPGGPWGRPPQGGGPGGTPPDLEELIRRSQDRLRRVLPGGGGLGVKGIAVLLVLAAVAITLWNSVFAIEEGQAGIVTRFGAYQAPPRQPGFNFMLWPIDQVQTIRVTRQNLEEIGFQTRGNTRREVPDEALMLTRDENIVSVGFTVAWSIRPDRPQDFLFNIADQQGAVRAVAESAMREVVGRNTAEDVITRGQTILQTEVTRILQETLDSYQSGIQVISLSISRPEVPPAVREAFNDVQQAGQDAQTFQNQSRRDANQLLADARAAANQLRQEADAYAQRVVAEAQGDTSRFLAIFNEYRQAPDVTRQRIFIETMERIFRGTNKIILDQAQGAQNVLPLLPLGRALEGLIPAAPAQGQTR
jgi:membrane protease subunit HflK